VATPPQPAATSPTLTAKPAANHKPLLVLTRKWWHGAEARASRAVETLSVDDAHRRRRAVLSGHTADEAEARALLDDPSPSVRASALGAVARMGKLGEPDLVAALGDPVPAVRRRACELAASQPGFAAAEVTALLDDADGRVVEAAAWSLGERGEARSDVVARLAHVATAHEDALCREAAVAALGALGDPAGLPAILAATSDRATVRRRAVIALAPFEGPDVDAALERARSDRDWQVRQAAEDLS
jgi:HEAT repeat protein